MKGRAGIFAALALVLLILVGAFTAFQAAGRMLKTLQWVDHTREVRLQLEQAMVNTVAAESAERGYLLTQQQAFKDAFGPAAEAARQSLLRVRTMTKDNPAQQERLARMMPVFEQKIARMQKQMGMRDEEGLDAVIDSVSTLEGKRMMDEFQALMIAMGAEENRLLKDRAGSARTALNFTSAVAAIGGGLAIALVALAAWTVHRELTSRRAARETVEAARAYAESIVDTVREPLLVVDKDLRVQSANRAFYDSFRHLPEDTCGKSISELDGGAWNNEELLQRLRETVRNDQFFTDFEMQIRDPSGGMRTLLLNGRKLYRPGNHQSASLLAMEDITEQKGLERMHLQFRSLFESLPGLYLVMKPDLTIVAVSDAYLKAVRCERNEIMGKRFIEAYAHGADEAEMRTLRAVEASLNRVLESGALDPMAIQRYDIPEVDGTVRESYWSPVNSAVFGQNGQVEYLVHRVEEVTDFVKSRSPASGARDQSAKLEKMEAEMFSNSRELEAVNQELRSANHELEAFSYSVSHDLRAPLRHVAGFSDLLGQHAKTMLDEKGKRYLDTILQSTKRMGQLIDDLLGFSRMARTELRYGKVNLDQLVASVIAEIEPASEGRRIEWNVHPLGMIEGDSAMLRQAFVNLISNALKYSRPRDPAVIEIGQHVSVPGIRGVFVRDNGVGFDPTYQDKLFGVFQRLHRAEEFEGTGIGLANVRRIITRHGGRIWAESRVNEGATFYFSLPEQTTGSTV